MSDLAKNIARNFRAHILRLEHKPSLSAMDVDGHVLEVPDLKELLQSRLGALRDVQIRQDSTGNVSWRAQALKSDEVWTGTISPQMVVTKNRITVQIEVVADDGFEP